MRNIPLVYLMGKIDTIKVISDMRCSDDSASQGSAYDEIANDTKDSIISCYEIWSLDEL